MKPWRFEQTTEPDGAGSLFRSLCPLQCICCYQTFMRGMPEHSSKNIRTSRAKYWKPNNLIFNVTMYDLNNKQPLLYL